MAKGKKETRRGSPEAIAKRRAARALNTLFDESNVAAAVDGRTAKRRRRIVKELQEGRKGEPLKAHEVLSYVTELLEAGETLTGIRKLKPRVPPAPPLTAETVNAIRSTQESYNFDPRAWKVLGVDIEQVVSGASNGAAAPKGSKRARKKKS